MKKVVSLVLALCLMVTMLVTGTFSVSAGTTVTSRKADLSKSDIIGAEEELLKMSVTKPETSDGEMTVDIYRYTRQFMSGDSINTSNKQMWLGMLVSLRYDDNTIIKLQAGKKYSVNVIYEVERIGGSEAQVGLVYNYNTNELGNNGSTGIAGKTVKEKGVYTLSATVAGQGGKPLRLVFGGQAIIKVKSVTVSEVSQSYEAADEKNVDLTKSATVNVSGATYSNFQAATDSEPLKIDVNGTVNNQFFDGANTWVNSWTKFWVKSALVTLKYDEDNYVMMDGAKSYKVVVTYKVTESTATETALYPEIAIVRNEGSNYTQDNGTWVIAGARVAPADVGVEKTLTATFDANNWGNRPLRLGFAGKGSFEVSSVKISEIPYAAQVTLIDDGISTTEYMATGSALPIPEKEGCTFIGWFDWENKKVTTVSRNTTLTAAWIKNSSVDLTKSEKIDGTHANMTLTVPTEAGEPLDVKISGYERLVMDGDTMRTSLIWAGGALVNLKYDDDTYLSLNSNSKYIVNVKYDVTSATSYNFPTQIAIVYNNSTVPAQVANDKGAYALAAKKHYETVTDAGISCVISGKDANVLRLLFDGQGSISVKSVTVTEAPADIAGFSAVKYTDNIYGMDSAVLSANGTVVDDLPRTLMHNFGGWYNGEEKVTEVSADVTLTAKWFEKTDVNMDNVTDIRDLINIKKALAAESENLVYDIDRSNANDAGDAVMLKKNLLGIDTVLIAGEDISSYSVRSGDMASF